MPGELHWGRSSGLTLLELTVAAAVIGILAAVAMPRFVTLLDGFRATAAADRIAVELRKTQLRARADGLAFQIRNATKSVDGRTVLALEVLAERENGLESLPPVVILDDPRLAVEAFGPFWVTPRGEFRNEGGFVRSPIRFALADAGRTVFVQRSGRILVR